MSIGAGFPDWQASPQWRSKNLFRVAPTLTTAFVPLATVQLGNFAYLALAVTVLDANEATVLVDFVDNDGFTIGKQPRSRQACSVTAPWGRWRRTRRARSH